MKKLCAATAAMVLMLLTACTSLTSGYVVDKQFTPAYDWMDLQCFSYDSKGMCTVRMPVQHHVPESWDLRIQNEDKYDWWSVDEATFNRTNIGDWVWREES